MQALQLIAKPSGERETRGSGRIVSYDRWVRSRLFFPISLAVAISFSIVLHYGWTRAAALHVAVFAPLCVLAAAGIPALVEWRRSRNTH
jgi:hypothetical protein